MSVAEEVKDILEDVSALETLMDGGFYDYDETGRLGVGFTSTPDAFDGAVMLPTLLVKVGAEMPFDEINDPRAQAKSMTQAINIHLYQEEGYDILEQAKDLIFATLHERRFDFGYTVYAGSTEGRQAEELNGASEIRLTYQRHFIKQP